MTNFGWSRDWFGTKVLRSSLGYHMIAPTLYDEVTEDIIAAEPACLKIVGDGDDLAMFCRYYEKLKDKTIFIARPWSPTQKIASDYASGKDPRSAANEYDQAISYLRPYLPRAYWDGWNEPGHPSQEIERWLGLFDERRIELAVKGDYGVACGAWSEGAPHVLAYDNDNSYERYLPALRAMHKAGPRNCIMTQHEYARQQDGGFLTQPWRIGRVNEVYKYLESIGIGGIWTVLGEYGRDAPKWKEVGLSDKDYADELTDPEVQSLYHPKVIGRLIYTLDRSSAWEKMDIHGGCFRLVNDYVKSQKITYYPPMPWHTGAPIPVDPPAPLPDPDPVVVPSGTIAVKTKSASGQNIRAHHSLIAPIVASLEAGEIAHTSADEAQSIGQVKSWVYVKVSGGEGWAAAWLLEAA